MSESFEKFKNRLKDKEIRQLWEKLPRVKAKFFDFFYKELLEYENLQIKLGGKLKGDVKISEKIKNIDDIKNIN